jgi:hypothetical protein
LAYTKPVDPVVTYPLKHFLCKKKKGSLRGGCKEPDVYKLVIQEAPQVNTRVVINLRKMGSFHSGKSRGNQYASSGWLIKDLKPVSVLTD